MRGKTTCFVGNVAYDVTEEQLIGILSQVGPVMSFRLVMDRDTGKPKGYGFCEYRDPETAASAVRNLNNYDLNGRNLRVDFAEGDGVVPGRDDKSGRVQQISPPLNYPPPPGPSHPPQQQLPTDAITALLGSMNANQLYDLMSQMKVLAQTNPDQAKQLLAGNPQLSYALFQAMVIMRLIPPQVIQQLMQQQMQQFVAASSGQAAYPPPQHGQSHTAGDMSNLNEHQRAALQQIMSLTEAQLNALPPGQRQQVLILKASLMQQQQRPPVQ